MLRFFPFSTFIFLLLLGCNSERAEMRRIASVLPTMFQFGEYSKLFPLANKGTDSCNSLIYSPSEEAYYCAGTTTSSVGEPLGSSSGDALLIKFNRRFEVQWVKQFGKDSYGQHTNREVFNAIAFDGKGNLIASRRINNSYMIMSFDKNGNFLWAGNTRTGVCGRLIVRDRIYCGGKTGTDAYVATYLLDGTFDWEKNLSATGSEYCNGFDVAPSGSILCAGSTEGELITAPIRDPDAFIWVLDHLGNTLKIRQVGDPQVEEVFENAFFDSQENVITVGTFIGSYQINTSSQYFGSFINNSRKTRNVFFQRFLNNNLSFDAEAPVEIDIPSAINRQILASQAILTSDDRIITCFQSHLEFGEPNADLSGLTSDIALGIFDLATFESIEYMQFGANTKGRFDNSGDQKCQGITQDQFKNIIVNGFTAGSTQEPNAGLDDIMIWRVGPNLEF